MTDTSDTQRARDDLARSLRDLARSLDGAPCAADRTARRAIRVSIAALVLAAVACFAAAAHAAASPPPDPGPAPYPLRVVLRQVDQWQRVLYPAQTRVGHGCVRLARTQEYDCYVDYRRPGDDRVWTHGLSSCRRRAAITHHAATRRVALVLVGRRVRYPGGVRCLLATTAISAATR